MARRTLCLPATIAAAILVACAAASLAASREAEAAFPGENGKTVFEMGPYGSYSRPTDIATANPDGSGFFRVAGDGSGDASGTHESDPAFSPDGTMVAFTKVEAEYESDIHAVPSDGGTPVPLTNNNISSAPDWAPSQLPAPPPDETAPQMTMTAGPAAYARSRTASLSFSSSEPGSTFRCRIDAGPFLPCSSPKVYQNLPDGRHAFLVAAADAAGNADPTPAGRTWTVDTARPSGRVTVNGGAASTRSRTVTLSLRASDPAPASGVASMRFKNAGRAWSSWRPYATRSSWTLTAGAGAKTFYVQYRDRAGNVSVVAYDKIAYRP